MKNHTLEDLNAKLKLSKGVGLIAIVGAIVYASVTLGSIAFQFWIAAILVITGVLAVVVSNVISIQIMKLESDIAHGRTERK